MRILVTGAQGQLGRCLQDQLATSKHVWHACTRAALDIGDQTQIEATVAAFEPSVVINAAAYTAVDAAESNASQAQRVNATGPAVLAAACTRAGASLLHVSTDYVFDGSSATAYREDDPTCPLGVYGQTKLAGEKAVLEAGDGHVVLRTAWVFSEYGSNFLKTMLRLATRDEIGVVSDQVGGPTYAGDLARVLLSIAERTVAERTVADSAVAERAPGGGLFHYCGVPPASWHDFALHIFSQAQALNLIAAAPAVRAITSDEFPTAATRPARSVLCNARISATYNVTPPQWRDAVPHVLKRIATLGAEAN